MYSKQGTNKQEFKQKLSHFKQPNNKNSLNNVNLIFCGFHKKIILAEKSKFKFIVRENRALYIKSSLRHQSIGSMTRRERLRNANVFEALEKLHRPLSADQSGEPRTHAPLASLILCPEGSRKWGTRSSRSPRCYRCPPLRPTAFFFT